MIALNSSHVRQGNSMACTCQAVLVLLAVLATCCNAELIMVYSIQRHGARNVLPKSSTLKESESTGGPTLLPQGQRQCYDAGSSFHARYIDSSTCSTSRTCLAAADTGSLYGVIGAPGVGFSNYNTYANTSSLDRTIMSADSFLPGAWDCCADDANTHTSTCLALVPQVGDAMPPIDEATLAEVCMAQGGCMRVGRRHSGSAAAWLVHDLSFVAMHAACSTSMPQHACLPCIKLPAQQAPSFRAP
ncbi:hypothetical protein COO60DRAFT_1496824 [Scenedesmus sp. NREL 46B-D3]|nr:hypothetical protein COO60DRAFT_1496824 [Scenedesmus sp. NREL 46B-D3]